MSDRTPTSVKRHANRTVLFVPTRPRVPLWAWATPWVLFALLLVFRPAHPGDEPDVASEQEDRLVLERIDGTEVSSPRLLPGEGDLAWAVATIAELAASPEEVEEELRSRQELSHAAAELKARSGNDTSDGRA